MAYVALSVIEQVWSKVELEDFVIQSTFKEQVLENLPNTTNQQMEALLLINNKEEIESKGCWAGLKRPFKKRGRRAKLFA